MKAFPITSKPSLIALAAGGALVFLALWCARHPAVPVETAAARLAQLTVEVNTNGKIEPLPEAEVRRYQPAPTAEAQLARAEWSLAWLLHQRGREEAAARHFDRAAGIACRTICYSGIV